MNELLLAGGKAYTPRHPLNHAWLLLRNGTIAALGQGTPPEVPAGTRRLDTSGCLIAPGFIDLHVHGGGGADVMDGTPEALRTIAQTHAAGGTTGWLGTTLAAPQGELLAAIDAAAPLVGQPLGGATLLGMHLEGPYLSLAQRGAHRAEYVRKPDPAEYEPLLQRLIGHSRMTVAPEVPGGFQLGEALQRRGVSGAIGHSDADLATVQRALDAGFRHVTHLYSCTSGLRVEGGYKTPGINEAALLLDELTVELIGDGHHVPPALIQLVVKVKGPERVCLVTDAIRAAGLGPGTYSLGGMGVLVEDGVAKLPDRSKFAGSVCTMAQAVRTAVAAGISLAQALQMASQTPAALLGLSAHKGELAPGKDADLVVLDRALEPQLTIVGGQVVFAAEGLA